MKIRNIEEQVLKNAEDIKRLQSGIVIDYWCSGLAELGTLLTTRNIGKYAVVDIDLTKHLYLITRATNEDLVAVDMGIYPAVVKGATGETGEQGLRGADGTGIYGCTAALPSPDAYKEGDFYLLYNGDVYKKINSHWIRQTNIKGPQGPVGLNGTVVIPNPVDEATDTLNKASIDGTIFAIPNQGSIDVEDLYDLVEGSDTVVVDYNEAQTKISFKLDEDVTDEIDSKLDASKAAVSAVGGLVIPNVAPIDHKLVGIDNTNGQELIGIGDGLTIESGNLKVSGGGGGNYVEKTNTPNVLYGTNHLGVTVSNYTVDTENSFGSIPLRNLDEDIEVPLTPSSNKAAASKNYVDTKVSQISVPTKTSDLTNDSGFITSSDIPSIHVYKHKLQLITETEEMPVNITIITKNQSQFTDVADLKLTLGGFNLANKPLISIVNFGDDRYFYFGIDRNDKYVLFDTQNSAFIYEDMKVILGDTVSSIDL